MLFRLRRARRAAFLLTALVAAAGVLLQAVVSIGLFRAQGGTALDAVWRILLYFTVLTNILVAAISLASLRDESGETALARPSTQSAGALYIAVVGIVYNAILASLWKPRGLQYLADVLLHDATPALYCLCWLLFARKGALPWSAPLRWFAYPLAYLAYALARGATGGLYPYPFIDVASLGAGAVAMNALAMLALFMTLGLGIVAVDRALSGRSDHR